MDTDILRAIQHYSARAAIGSSSMRNAGSAGVVERAREFLGQMELRPFGTANRATFLAHLDAATEDLKRALPKPARHWGLARKGLNIFLRNCLYTTYLREEYGLARAEEFFEVPLDKLTGECLTKASASLPRWKTIRGLSAKTSAEYQAEAAKVAAKKRIARVHLDAVWWGEREDA